MGLLLHGVGRFRHIPQGLSSFPAVASVVRLYLLPLGPLLGIVAGFSGSVFLPCRDSVFKVLPRLARLPCRPGCLDDSTVAVPVSSDFLQIFSIRRFARLLCRFLVQIARWPCRLGLTFSAVGVILTADQGGGKLAARGPWDSVGGVPCYGDPRRFTAACSGGQARGGSRQGPCTFRQGG